MSLKPCPFCAENVQEEAILCKHCGQSLSQPMTPPLTTQTPVPHDEILATYEVGQKGGSYAAMFCLRDRILLRQTVSASTTTVVIILILICTLAYVIPGIVGFLVYSLIRKRRYHALRKYKTLASLPLAPGDQVIPITPGAEVSLLKGQGLMAPQLRVCTAQGLQQYFIQDRQAYAPLRALYPTLAADQ